MALLADPQWSVNRLLIAKVAAGISHGGDLGRVAAEGMRLLAALDAEHPAAVREVLTYPYVQAWASSCLRSPRTVDRDLDRAHLAGIAGAAALRAGIEAELALPVRRGSVYLPAVGAFALPAGAGSSTLVRVSPSEITSARGIRQWRTVRRLSAGAISVTVDDIDPFRDCQAWAPATRLTAAGWESWRQGLTKAGASRANRKPEDDTVRRFRTYRSWVETTIEAMLAAGSLRPAGERFVEGMRATVKGWADDW